MSENFTAPDGTELEKLRRRDAGAVERWFLDNADAVYTFVLYRVGRDEELTAEVVQETFLTALRRIERYDPARGSVPTWLSYVARNCIRAALKERGRYATLGEAWESIDRNLASAYREIASEPLPDQALESDETAGLVQMALSNIPEGYRHALTQHYYDHRSIAEMARSRGSTDGATKALLHRARLAFKAAFLTIADSLDGVRRVTP